ncbi:YgiQ family radical SAM protein [Geobacter grbiciae]|uniref:YgiQ family radical SAM protein n=1 Tax=Geobacter grbiciae TaxID=155042 RepID=UPI001C00D22E|nr:YgiQ family radical SAM protein [Geobacter grbiciae]MBT1076320.1 YgiQ family radical SAM protein [Geobacter grbiciae]
MSFLPTTRAEALKRGWHELDVVFVTGDAYIDHPAFGVPLLARWLESHGFRVGIIPQPDWRSREPFMALGRPRLFFAVAAGAMDSMVAHYTPLKKLRHDDAYTPGGRHGARPNRATIVYTSRLKEAFKDVPVVVGGIEASLRRFAHYDYWEDKVRRSILFDAKADLLVFGMGERPILELAERLSGGEPLSQLTDIPGTAYAARGDVPSGALVLPTCEEVMADPRRYAEAFRLVTHEMNPGSGKALAQRHGERLLVCNPPSVPLSEAEIDAVYALPFARAPHPSYKEPIPAYDQIKSSITTHRGCFGGCAFCAITHHQGKFIQSRSEHSVTEEVGRMVKMPWFRGSVSDVGGPTANMYGLRCGSPDAGKGCRRESCLFPSVCRHLVTHDRRAATLLRRVRAIPGVRHVAVSSGIRYDLLERQPGYFGELLAHHVGGFLKVAPEHTVDVVTDLMRKPGKEAFERFLARFRDESMRLGRKQYVIPYLMSGHPGCTLDHMVELALFLKRHNMRVDQVQDFTPTPGTLATCMYHTGIDPFSGRKVYVARSDREKRLQKALLLWHQPEERRNVLEALRACGREEAAAELLGGFRQREKCRSAPRGGKRRP